MENLIIYSGGEWFIQDGFTELRSPQGDKLPDQMPKFFKATIEEIRAHYCGTSKNMPIEMGAKLKVIGSGHRRGDTGKFTPGKLFYTLVPEEEINPQTGDAYAEERTLTDIAEIFADKFRQYCDGHMQV